MCAKKLEQVTKLRFILQKIIVFGVLFVILLRGILCLKSI